MNQLSVVIITFNEERNIGRCLQSVRALADEILVVDSFSTDRTAEICASFNVRFYSNPFAGHIEQKNYALTLASYPYILSLDADEELSPELTASLFEIKNNPIADGYYFNRLTNYCGKWIRHGGWYPDQKLRYFEKGKAQWGGKNPHDQLLLHDPKNKKFLKGDLLHYSYYSLEDHLKQVNSFTTIGARSAFEEGQRAGMFSLIIKPIYKFIRDYILLGGFLDGYYGFIIARISANATYLKYAKLRELWRRK